MEHVSAWLGATVVTAGMSAALLAGAGAAAADTDSGSDSGGTSSSKSADSGADKADSSPTDKTEKSAPTNKTDKSSTASPKPDRADDRDEAKDAPTTSRPDTDSAADEPTASPVTDEPATEQPTDTVAEVPAPETPDAEAPDAEPVADAPPAGAPQADADTTENKPAADPEPSAAPTPATPAAPAPTAVRAPVVGTEPEAPEPAPVLEPAPEPVVVAPIALRKAAAESEQAPPAAFVAASAIETADIAAAAAAPAAPDLAASLLSFVSTVIGSVVTNIGSLALTALQAVEALAAGPPVLPPGSTVTVRDSWITLGNGQRIAANWYYPEGDTAPDKMILLQHGLLALGPMYSFTAANLAERTGAIVVTPSITSNFFLGDDHWLGGIGMAEEIAALFSDDRAALTQSALDAGYADRYGLGPETAALPLEFALVGHSLGGHLVSAAAGFLAANGGAENLVGVISLDGVPLGNTMPEALAKLDAYETNGGAYIPIREIGAPWNIYNAFSNINQSLSAARPDHFNGVVLANGVHMDSMQGGNQLIQFAAYVAAGFPQPQNPLAVQDLAVQWLGEWFGGNPFVGDGVLTPGSTIEIDTPEGTAVGTVIGDPPAARLGEPFPTAAPTDVPRASALLTTLVV